MTYYNKETVKNQVLNSVETIANHLFPAGKKKGKLFLVGNIDGKAGESLKLELTGSNRGLWHDMATGEGGDMLDLWAKRKGLDIKRDFGNVLESIGRFLSVPCEKSKYSVPAKKEIPTGKKSYPHGKWEYFDENGLVVASITRFLDKDGKKYFVPWDEIEEKTQMPTIRPLYNLPNLPSANEIFVVEGEKAAEALIKSGVCATTAMGGCNAPLDKTDWSCLDRKNIVIWPDNDTAGKKYAERLTEFLKEQNVDSISIFSIPAEKEKGWDAADALSEGILEQFLGEVERKLVFYRRRFCVISDRVADIKPLNILPDIIGPRLLTPKGMLVFMGQPKAGKTTFLLSFLSTLSVGKEFLGMRPPRPLKILYIQFELELEYVHEKFLEVRKPIKSNFNSSNNNNLQITEPLEITLNEDGERDIRNLVLDTFPNETVDIFVFDPLFSFFDSDDPKANENDSNAMKAFLKRLKKLCLSFNPNAGIILVHHTKKMITKEILLDPFNSYSGSGQIRTNYTTGMVLALTEDMKSPERRIFFEGRYGTEERPLPQTKVIEKEGPIWREIGESSTSLDDANRITLASEKKQAKKQKIIDLLFNESWDGKVYTFNSFSASFENSEGLGAARSIRHLLIELANTREVKFFRNYQKYDLPPFQGGLGYLWVPGMRMPSVCEKTKLPIMEVIHPTHQKDMHLDDIVPIQ